MARRISHEWAQLTSIIRQTLLTTCRATNLRATFLNPGQVDGARWKTRNIDQNLQRKHDAQVEGFCISYFAAFILFVCSLFSASRPQLRLSVDCSLVSQPIPSSLQLLRSYWATESFRSTCTWPSTRKTLPWEKSWRGEDWNQAYVWVIDQVWGQDGWMDISQVVFLRKNNEANIQPSWPKKLGQ